MTKFTTDPRPLINQRDIEYRLSLEISHIVSMGGGYFQVFSADGTLIPNVYSATEAKALIDANPSISIDSESLTNLNSFLP